VVVDTAAAAAVVAAAIDPSTRKPTLHRA